MNKKSKNELFIVAMILSMVLGSVSAGTTSTQVEAEENDNKVTETDTPEPTSDSDIREGVLNKQDVTSGTVKKLEQSNNDKNLTEESQNNNNNNNNSPTQQDTQNKGSILGNTINKISRAVKPLANVDSNKTFTVNYDANGGQFDDGSNSKTITYTELSDQIQEVRQEGGWKRGDISNKDVTINDADFVIVEGWYIVGYDTISVMQESDNGNYVNEKYINSSYSNDVNPYEKPKEGDEKYEYNHSIFLVKKINDNDNIHLRFELGRYGQAEDYGYNQYDEDQKKYYGYLFKITGYKVNNAVDFNQLDTIKNSGFTFNDWYENGISKNTTNIIYDSNVNNSDVLNVKANWVKQTTKITFDANGGEFDKKDNMSNYEKISDDFKLYEFTITRTYDFNDGKLKYLDDGYAFEQLSLYTPLKKNPPHILSDWNTEPDGSGISYKNESEIYYDYISFDDIKNIQDNLTLYAIWSDHKVTIDGYFHIGKNMSVKPEKNIKLRFFVENESTNSSQIYTINTDDLIYSSYMTSYQNTISIPISLDVSTVDETLKYKVFEINDEVPGMTYDDSVYEVTIGVTDSDSYTEASILYRFKYPEVKKLDEKPMDRKDIDTGDWGGGANVKFNNSYTKPLFDHIFINKQLKNALPKRNVNFKVNVEDGNDGNKIINTIDFNTNSFEKNADDTYSPTSELQTFTFTNTGDYKYKIYEVNTHDTAFTYDTNIYNVEYNVTKDDNGNLTAKRTITKNNDNISEKTITTDDTQKTNGDSKKYDIQFINLYNKDDFTSFKIERKVLNEPPNDLNNLSADDKYIVKDSKGTSSGISIYIKRVTTTLSNLTPNTTYHYTDENGNDCTYTSDDKGNAIVIQTISKDKSSEFLDIPKNSKYQVKLDAGYINSITKTNSDTILSNWTRDSYYNITDANNLHKINKEHGITELTPTHTIGDRREGVQIAALTSNTTQTTTNVNLNTDTETADSNEDVTVTLVTNYGEMGELEVSKDIPFQSKGRVVHSSYNTYNQTFTDEQKQSILKTRGTKKGQEYIDSNEKLSDTEQEEYNKFRNLEFNFTITFTNMTAGTIIQSDHGPLTADNDGKIVDSINVKANGKGVTYTQIPLTAKYDVKEELDSQEYNTSYSLYSVTEDENYGRAVNQQKNVTSKDTGEQSFDEISNKKIKVICTNKFSPIIIPTGIGDMNIPLLIVVMLSTMATFVGFALNREVRKYKES